MFWVSRVSGRCFRQIRWCCCGVLLLWCFTNSAQSAPADPRHSAERKNMELWTAALPMQFEANAGQTASEVKFLARGPGYQVFLTSTQAVISLVTGTVSKAEKLAALRGEHQAVEAATQRA